MTARELLIEAWKLRNPSQVAEIEALLDVLPSLGLAIVPREPTEAMVENIEIDRISIDHARALHSSSIDFVRIYKAMITAALEQKP